MSKYFYNERKLPELPEWDKEARPVAVLADGYGWGSGSDNIYDYTGEVRLFLFQGRISVGKTGDKYGHVNGLYTAHCYTLVDGAWRDEGVTYTASALAFWSNTDLYFEKDEDLGELSGALFLKASDPVPVPTPQDFYITKNGAGQKQDVYLRVGGKSVKQDEYVT